MYYDAKENTGQVTLEMLQKAYAETLGTYKYEYPMILCNPEEYPWMKESMEKIFGK